MTARLPVDHKKSTKSAATCSHVTQTAFGWGTYRQIKTGARFKLEHKNGPFSAVSKPKFASKYSLESSRRDLHNALESNALLCTVL